MNMKKTKTMVMSKKEEITNMKIKLDGQEVEQVSKFVYLGELITENGKRHKQKNRNCKEILHQNADGTDEHRQSAKYRSIA